MELLSTTILLFCVVILISNIIQGITGFAGTLIAMPFLILLIDLDTAKQVLNFLGIVASIWIVSRDHCCIDWKQVKKILIFMIIGLVVGILSYAMLPKEILLFLFPLFVLFVGIKGLITLLFLPNKKRKKRPPFFDVILLIMAGIIHGLFVSGGPLLVAYATANIKGKHEFRATLSIVWIVLNSLILFQNIFFGAVTSVVLNYMLIAILPLFIGILIGGILLKKMSQKAFMLLSYVLLIFSGISLLF